MVANNADDPPFASFISTTTYQVVAQIPFNGTEWGTELQQRRRAVRVESRGPANSISASPVLRRHLPADCWWQLR